MNDTEQKAFSYQARHIDILWRRAMTRRTPAQFLFGTLGGTCIVFLLAAIATILLCSALLTVSEELAVEANLTQDEERTKYTTKLWESYGLFIDPGAQSGVDSTDKHEFYLFVVVTFSLIGFTWVLLAFGVLQKLSHAATMDGFPKLPSSEVVMGFIGSLRMQVHAWSMHGV